MYGKINTVLSTESQKQEYVKIMRLILIYAAETRAGTTNRKQILETVGIYLLRKIMG